MNKIIILVFLLFNILNAEFIRDNELDIVLDTSTNLLWEDGADNKKSFSTALLYCQTKSIEHFIDKWRLPNYNELLSIVKFDNKNAKIDSAFNNTKVDGISYWTSTLSKTYYDLNNTQRAWNINFASGYDNVDPITNSLYTRCVHDF